MIKYNSVASWHLLFLVYVLIAALPSLAQMSEASLDRRKRDSSSFIPPRPNSSQTIRQRLTRDSVLPCKYLEKAPEGLREIEWWYRGVGYELVGTFDPRVQVAVTNWSRDGAYALTNNGTLRISDARRELVERYDCVARLGGHHLLVHAVYFRLDFSFWYAVEPNSLFFGSCLAAVIFCAASFLLNVIWIICRHTILWWIKRTGKNITKSTQPTQISTKSTQSSSSATSTQISSDSDHS